MAAPTSKTPAQEGPKPVLNPPPAKAPAVARGRQKQQPDAPPVVKLPLEESKAAPTVRPVPPKAPEPEPAPLPAGASLDPNRLYDVRLAGPVTVGSRTLTPRHRHMILGSVITAMAPDVRALVTVLSE